MSGARMSLPEKLLDNVERLPWSGCWIWLGPCDGSDYGQIYLNQKNSKARASRIAWEFANKLEMPKELHACHSCDIPACINPAHIWPGTQTENIRDAIKKGRDANTVRPKATHCKRGHEFTQANTLIQSNGCRRCLICQKTSVAEWTRKFRRRAGSLGRERQITFAGITRNLREWSLSLGLSNTAVQKRLYCGWPLALALTTKKATKP